MKAVIPVAGYATRLHPLTIDRPKALLEVSGQSILDHFFSKMAASGDFDEVVIVSNDKFFSHFQSWATQASYPFPITVVNDGTTSNEDRLGAVGDFILGLEHLSSIDHVLISAGDGMFEDDFQELFKLFKDKGTSIVATKQMPREVCQRCGVAGVDDQGKITSFIEKPSEPPSDLVGIMTYLIHKDDVQHLHEAYAAWENDHEMNSGEAIRHLITKSNIYSYPVQGAWFDIGTPEHLEEARRYFR
jgi:glucose-1-phosphate thymidylyltransferase